MKIKNYNKLFLNNSVLNQGYYSKFNNIINCYVIGPSNFPKIIASLICFNILISIFWLIDSPQNLGTSLINTKLWTNFIFIISLLFLVGSFIYIWFCFQDRKLSILIILIQLILFFFIFNWFTLVKILFFIFPIISWLTTFLWIYNWMLSLNNWESQKFLTNAVQKNIIQGFYLFAISEIMLFFGFFWAFFHFAWSPSIELGGIWPPIFLDTVNPFGLPVLNTILLMSSGFILSIALKTNALGDTKSTKIFVYMSILLGICFLAIQRMEFLYSGFLPSQSIFGTTFFALTSLHGFHVVLGLIGLILFLIQIENTFSIKQNKILKYVSNLNSPGKFLIFTGNFKDQALAGFLAAFYWHLVDAIWIFLVIVLYFNFPLVILAEIIFLSISLFFLIKKIIN
jgi:heme/copper-type cytochrome/quinol oxidase subunit 3